jgi:hypothetical protein
VNEEQRGDNLLEHLGVEAVLFRRPRHLWSIHKPHLGNADKPKLFRLVKVEQYFVLERQPNRCSCVLICHLAVLAAISFPRKRYYWGVALCQRRAESLWQLRHLLFLLPASNFDLDFHRRR